MYGQSVEDAVFGIIGLVKRGCCAWRLHSHTTHSYEALAGVEVTADAVSKGLMQRLFKKSSIL